MAKTKELKKRYGAEEGRIITSVFGKSHLARAAFPFQRALTLTLTLTLTLIWFETNRRRKEFNGGIQQQHISPAAVIESDLMQSSEGRHGA